MIRTMACSQPENMRRLRRAEPVLSASQELPDTEAIEDNDLAKLVNDIIAAMNERMKSEEDGMLATELPVELLPALDLLREIRDHMDRFHSDDLRTASVTVGGQASGGEGS